MRFTKHAIDKLSLFALTEEDVLEGLSNPELVCNDVLKGSTIYVFKLRKKLYSAVVKDEALITIYRTDEKKLYSRRRSGRWSCY